jgi:hypothetical protein
VVSTRLEQSWAGPTTKRGRIASVRADHLDADTGDDRRGIVTTLDRRRCIASLGMDDRSTERDRLELLLSEYERAIDHTDRLWTDLTADEVYWRPSPESSAIGWHLGHQAAVAHFMVRNLVAAEPSIDPRLDELMDSATPEADRGSLPPVDDLRAYRTRVADRVRVRIGDILAGRVGAPRQLVGIGTTLLTAIVDHEYQHSTWIGEVRAGALGHPLPDPPTSDALTDVDGYIVLR